MERVARWIARRVWGGMEPVEDPGVRSRYGLLEGTSGVLTNLVLVGLKLGAGLAWQSAGLVADSIHSLTDVASSAVVILSFRVARKPPDREHPFGHAKAEYVATLIVSIFMVLAGWELLQTNSLALLRGIGTPQAAPPPVAWPLLAALLGLLLISEAQSRFSAALGRIIQSAALKADGWHFRTDALATGVVIAGLAGRNLGVPWLDAAAGAAVGGFIIATGIRMALNAISPLLGESVPQADLKAMRALAEQIPEIVSVHDLAVHRYGHFYYTTIHAELSDSLDVHKMHEISEQLERRIRKRFPGECVVHVDPVNLAHPLYIRATEALREVVVRHPLLVQFRDLSLWSEGGEDRGAVEVSVDPKARKEDYPALAQHIERALQEHLPKLRMSVHLKVDFSATPLTA